MCFCKLIFFIAGYNVLPQDQFMGIHQHQTQKNLENQNVTGMALGPPLQSTGGFQDMGSSVHQENLVDPFEDWPHQHENVLLSEEEIRLRSHEMLESEDMQQLLQLCSMGGNGEDGYGFPSPMVQGYEEDRVRSGKAVVGWLKIKAAMKWGIFIRKKAAERRAQIVELD